MQMTWQEASMMSGVAKTTLRVTAAAPGTTTKDMTGDVNDRRCQPPETTATAKTTGKTTMTRTLFEVIWDLRPGSVLTPGTNDSRPGIWELTWDQRPGMTWDQDLQDDQAMGPEDVKDVNEAT
jgi:hypothetical protein